MTTLREILEEVLPCVEDEPCPGDPDVFVEVWCENCKQRRAIESWAYGQERECPWYGCRGPISDPACPDCHGTGTIREPGLVERVSKSEEARAIMRKHGFKFETRLDQSEGFEKLAFTFYTLLCEAESALRAELGVEP